MHCHNSHRFSTFLARAVCALGLVTISLLSLLSCAAKAKDELVIYAYDSFVSEWGTGPLVMPLFEKATGIKASLVSRGDSGAVLAALIEEKAKPQADVVVGIDQYILFQADRADVLETYLPKGIEDIDPSLRFDPKGRLCPYDYGHFAIIWDTQALQAPPRSLAELALPAYKGKLILMDPRSSTPGLGFLAWTLSAYGKDWEAYWRSLKPSILTISSGWDSGYGLFVSGEAPLVLSYATSPAYHRWAEQSDRYQALDFAEGHPLQIEGAAIVKGTRNRKNAERFMDFILSKEFQAEIPLSNWMYPVRSDIELPPAYSRAIRPKTLPLPDASLLSSALELWQDVASR